MLLALISGMFGTLYSSLYKSIKDDMDISTILILRSALQVFAMAILTGSCVKILPTNMEEMSGKQQLLTWFFVINVGLLGGLRLCFNFCALAHIPLALHLTIVNGSPVLVRKCFHLSPYLIMLINI
jgi:hypothetical protein